MSHQTCHSPLWPKGTPVTKFITISHLDAPSCSYHVKFPEPDTIFCEIGVVLKGPIDKNFSRIGKTILNQSIDFLEQIFEK